MPPTTANSNIDSTGTALQTNGGNPALSAPAVQSNPVSVTTAKSSTPLPISNSASVSSSAVLSNGNKMDQVPAIVSKTDALSKTGITTDQSGTPTYANGTLVPSLGTENPNTTPNAPANANSGLSQGGYIGEIYYPVGAQLPTGADGKYLPTTPTSPSSDQVVNNLNALKGQTDALTASTIDAIHSQYANLVQQQEIANNAQNSQMQNALLMGGVTGQGSSAQYAPISSSGIIGAQINYGIQQIANLNADEQTKIVAAQQAGLNEDYQLMDKLNTEITNIRQQKIDAATKLNDQITSQNQKIQSQNLQSAQDRAISDLYAAGTTDVKSILAKLKDQGINATADDVSKTIDSIAKNNGIDTTNLDSISKEFFALKTVPNGLPSSITSLPDITSQLAAFIHMYNLASASGKALIDSSNGSAIANPVVQTTMNMIGLSQDMPVSDAINSVGMQAIIDGLVKQEGGTPQGTNNPGNIKFADQIGATKGKAATDGGNFANFSSPQAFNNAISALITKASANGENMSDFIAQYKGVANTTANVPGTTGNAAIDATAKGYATTAIAGAGGLTQSAIDQAALQYAMTGKLPALRGVTAALTGQQKQAVQNRAGELNAGGNIAANQSQLKALSSSMAQQQKYYDTIDRAYTTAQDNLGVITKLMTDNNINSSNVPLINTIKDKVKAHALDPGTIAAFQANLQGLRAEYSQVLAKGGARSVETDNEANKLIPDNLSPVQLQKVASQLALEGGNAVKEAKNQVSNIQDSINGIISPKPLISGNTHNGAVLPTSSPSAYSKGQYTFNIPQ